MPAGNQPDAPALHSMLANNATGLRSVCETIRQLWAYVGPLGEEGLAAPPINMAPDDVADYYAAASEMQSVAAAYFGTGTLPDLRDHDSALAPVRGGR